MVGVEYARDPRSPERNGKAAFARLGQEIKTTMLDVSQARNKVGKSKLVDEVVVLDSAGS